MVKIEENLKDKIICCFKELLRDFSFDRITVTMIAKKAGILRPVFYNHFKDKYELMDYMLYTEVTREIQVLIEHDMIEEAIRLLFTHIMKEEKLYKKLFDTVGQNSFEKVMEEQFITLFQQHLKIFNTNMIPENPLLTPLNICKFLVLGLTTSIKECLNASKNYTVEQAVEAYFFLVSHSIFDITRDDFKPKLFQNRIQE